MTICSSLLSAPLVQCRQPVLTEGGALVPKLPVTCAILAIPAFSIGSGKRKEKKVMITDQKTSEKNISIAGINISHCLRYLSYTFCSLDQDMTQHSYKVRLNKEL